MWKYLLNEREAYEAMFRFVRAEWEISRSSADMAGFLGGIAPTAPDSTRMADLSAWPDWMRVVEEVIAEREGDR